MAIDGVTVGSFKDVAHDAACNLRGEDDRNALRLHLPGAETPQGTLRRDQAHLFRGLKQAGCAGARIPEAALHAALLVARNGSGRKAAGAAARFTFEAARIDHHLVRGGGVEVAAIRVLDARVVGHGSGFAASRNVNAAGWGQVVYIFKVKSKVAGKLAEFSLVWKPGEGVFARHLGKLDRARNQPLQTFARKIGGGGRSRAQPPENAQTDGPRAGLLEGLHLAQPHERGEFFALVGDALGVGRAGLQSTAEHFPCQKRQIGLHGLGCRLHFDLSATTGPVPSSAWPPGRRWPSRTTYPRRNTRSRF